MGQSGEKTKSRIKIEKDRIKEIKVRIKRNERKVKKWERREYVKKERRLNKKAIWEKEKSLTCYERGSQVYWFIEKNINMYLSKAYKIEM